MNKKRTASGTGFAAIGTAALFLAGFLLLVVFGARSFRDAARTQSLNGADRAVLSYLATSVKGNDTAGAVRVLETEEGQVLSLSDGDSGYALRIYRRGNDLVEDFAREGAELDPERAEIIGQTETFEISCGDGLLEIVTDAGRVLLHVRSGEGS